MDTDWECWSGLFFRGLELPLVESFQVNCKEISMLTNEIQELLKEQAGGLGKGRVRTWQIWVGMCLVPGFYAGHVSGLSCP